MDLFLSNFTVLELVKLEMLRRARACTNDNTVLADLEEAIDTIHQDFLIENESTLLQRDQIQAYSRTNFEAIVEFFPSHILHYWKATPAFKKILILVPFWFASRRIRNMVHVAKAASSRVIFVDS